MASRLADGGEALADVREAFVYSLGQHEQTRHFDIVADLALADPSGYVRQSAWLAAARIAPHRFRARGAGAACPAGRSGASASPSLSSARGAGDIRTAEPVKPAQPDVKRRRDSISAAIIRILLKPIIKYAFPAARGSAACRRAGPRADFIKHL